MGSIPQTEKILATTRIEVSSFLKNFLFKKLKSFSEAHLKFEEMYGARNARKFNTFLTNKNWVNFAI